MKPFLVVFALASLACDSLIGDEKEPVVAAADPFESIAGIARALVEDHAPHWRQALNWPLIITDGGSYWVVSFLPPEIMEGGPPDFYIEKGTTRLVKIERYQ